MPRSKVVNKVVNRRIGEGPKTVKVAVLGLLQGLGGAESQARMRDPTVALCLIWAAILLYGEMFAFWVPPLWTCSWPRPSPMSGMHYTSDYTKVAVITDPQIMDKTSLPLAPKSLALEMAQFYTDLYMRRAFLGSILPFKPDIILFLGDYFDGGPLLSDEEWQESWNRFKHIFNLNALGRDTNIQIYYLPGNHDIGYAAFHSHMPQVINRYEKEFGARNYQFTAGKVDFIAIDAQTLDGKSEGNFSSATWNFVKSVSKDVSSNPRVLLTHIPLYRPNWTSCGPHRSSRIINQRISLSALNQEILYQNYVTEEKSNHLLEMIRPVLILSGHDHDQCTVTHMSKHGPVEEHTLGTISWQQGNLYPSFMLFSASNPLIHNLSSIGNAVLTQLCFLPAQTYIYIWYLSLFVLTLLVLLLWPTNGIGFSHHFGRFMGYIRSLEIFKGATKEKSDDENCEYEMIWGADGSMHLIKKTVEAPAKPSTERNVVERGTAVLRPTAKKQISQEAGSSVSLDVNVQMQMDAMGKMLPRTNKSKTKMVIRRLVRTFQMLSVIAAVNVPLYMMLLFKDWIDK